MKQIGIRNRVTFSDLATQGTISSAVAHPTKSRTHDDTLKCGLQNRTERR
jgi:hypothetical protein